MPSILIVSHDFPPDFSVGGKRALRMARHLPELGWRVQVLTVREAYSESLDPSLLESKPNFEILRTHAFEPKLWIRRLRTWFGGRPIGAAISLGGTAENLGAIDSFAYGLSAAWDTLFSLPDEWVGWTPFALISGLWRATPADLILATIPPFTNAIIGAMLSRLRRIPLVLDYRDPWSTRHQEPRLGWRRRVDLWLERRCLRQSSLAITTTCGIQQEIASLHPPRTLVIPNAFDPEMMAGIAATKYDRFTIVYAGNFYGTRTARPLLQAIRLLRDSGRLPARGLALRVIGVSGSEVLELAERLGVRPFVEIEPWLPYREALARMKGADVLLLVVGATHTHQIPAKLFDYLGAHRFILALAPPGSEAGSLVMDLGAGQAVDPQDERSIIRSLEARFGADGGARGFSEAIRRYETGTTMSDLDRCLREVLASRPEAPQARSDGTSD